MATQASDTSSKTRARGSSDELAVIAQRAQAFTNASGTAIALSEGNSDEITCRARSGSTAPEVGTLMRVEGSFTGLCIHSGKELRCDDAETDTRVDTAGLRALGIRSLVVTPIKEDNRVVGVLMVFAPTPHAFTITHVAVLKTMADQISGLLQRERKAKEEGVLPEPVRPAPAPVPVAKPAPVLPAPVVIKPSATAPRTAAFPVVSRVEPIKTAPLAEEVIPAAAPLKKEDRRDSRPEHRVGLGTLDSVAGESKKANNNLKMIGIAAAVAVVAAVGTFAYRNMSNKRPTAAAPTAQQQAPSDTPSAANGQTSGNAPGALAPGQPGANGATGSAGPGNTLAATTSPAASSKPAPGSPTGESRRVEKTVVPNPPPAKPSPSEVVIAAAQGTSKIAGNGGDSGIPDITPVLNAPGTSNSGGPLSSLTNPAASSTPSMITQSALEPVQVLKRVSPVYPAIARARRLSGTVTVQATVTREGKATNLQFVSGPPVFRDAAFEAVRQWQFKPARLNGQPIEQTEQIRMSFTPN